MDKIKRFRELFNDNIEDDDVVDSRVSDNVEEYDYEEEDPMFMTEVDPVSDNNPMNDNDLYDVTNKY